MTVPLQFSLWVSVLFLSSWLLRICSHLSLCILLWLRIRSAWKSTLMPHTVCTPRSLCLRLSQIHACAQTGNIKVTNSAFLYNSVCIFDMRAFSYNNSDLVIKINSNNTISSFSFTTVSSVSAREWADLAFVTPGEQLALLSFSLFLI